MVTEVVGDARPGWTFHRAVDSCISTDRAWRELRHLPGLDQVLTAGSARGVSEGLDELVARARADAFARATIMAGGGLLPEHVPWLVRAGVRAFHIGSSARPLGSWKAYVDPDLVADLAQPDGRAVPTPSDAAAPSRARRPAASDRLHRRPDLARPRPALVPPGQRHLVRGAARVRRAGSACRARAFERDHYDVIAERFDDARRGRGACW